MIWRLKIFGVVIASLEHEEDDLPSDIGGGSMHNFDLDEKPYSPDDRYNWDTDRFGFR